MNVLNLTLLLPLSDEAAAAVVTLLTLGVTMHPPVTGPAAVAAGAPAELEASGDAAAPARRGRPRKAAAASEAAPAPQSAPTVAAPAPAQPAAPAVDHATLVTLVTAMSAKVGLAAVRELLKKLGAAKLSDLSPESRVIFLREGNKILEVVAE